MKNRTIALVLTGCIASMLAACGSRDISTREPDTITESDNYDITENVDVPVTEEEDLSETNGEKENAREAQDSYNIEIYVYIVQNTVNYLALRTEPETDQSNEIGKLNNGDIFYVEYFTDNGFAYGKTSEDLSGYVNANYLVSDTEYADSYSTGDGSTSEYADSYGTGDDSTSEYADSYSAGDGSTSGYAYDGEDIPPMDYTSAELQSWNSGDAFTSTDLLTGKWQEDMDSNDIYIEFSYDGSRMTWYMYSMVTEFGDTHPFEFNSGVAYVYYEDGFGYYMECMSAPGKIYQTMDLSDITDGVLNESDGDIFYKIG